MHIYSCDWEKMLSIKTIFGNHSFYSHDMYTVEPRFNEVSRDWETASVNRGFVISMFVFHIFYCD